MTERVKMSSTPSAALRDIAELGKPRITSLVAFTAAIGLLLAPGSLGAARTALFLAATVLLVASANTLNCWMEREVDARMIRTRRRPLPAGRLEPRTALLAGIAEAGVALPLLLVVANPLTAALGAIALAVYVLVYTPLKRVSPVSLAIGSVPGAIPPLMGWTAATGTLAAGGWELFGILFCWQLPHFIAIALYLEEDYRRGGLNVLPVVSGRDRARRWLLASTGLLVAVSVLAVPLGLAGLGYLACAATMGAVFVALAWAGVRRSAGGAWARRAFLFSLVYLTVVISALVLDAR